MPTVSIATDKVAYAPGEQIVVTMSIETDAAATENYVADGDVTINGTNYSRSASFSVTDATEVSAPSVSIRGGIGAPSIALTPHPTLPNTWVGVAPNV